MPAITTRRPSTAPALETPARFLARWRAALILLGLGVSCFGCFTDPINRAPVVTSINTDSPPVMRGKPASFTATAYDPDSDSFTISWAKTGTCTNIADRSMWPPATSFGPRLPVDMGETGASFCVWAFATDRFGAVGAFNLPVYPGDSPPVAMIALLSPPASSLYQLYTTFQLSNHSVDPEADPFTGSTWKLETPPGSMAQLLGSGCQSDPTSNDVQCFRADVPGHYKVVLTVTTDDTQSSMDTMALDVNVDTLPCIDLLSCVPMLDGTPVLDPAKDQSFTVSRVIDDGDSAPLVGYNWFFTVNGALLPFEHDYPTLPIPPDQYHEGDVTKIRVEVYDRNRQADIDALSLCGDADRCAGDPQRPTCVQRVTWTVNWL